MLKQVNGNILINENDISTLKKYDIIVNKYSTIQELLFKIDQILNDDEVSDEEYDELDYIANNLQERNYYKNTKPQFEGYEQYEGAFHLSVLLGWYLSMEILNARNNSIKNNTYFFHLRNCDAFIAYKKYNASTKRGYLKIINDFSIPKYKDADGTIGL